MNSDNYFKTQDGGCRHVAGTADRLSEFPFTTNLTIRCDQAGPHPHLGSSGSQMLAIKPDMSDPAELTAAARGGADAAHGQSAGSGAAV
jgi:hypothetical protein